MSLLQDCPCGQGQYANCCQPLHSRLKIANTAEQLMRSRYSAFALQQVNYILQTTALGQQTALDRDAIADWSQSNDWLKLEVIQHQPKVDKTHALVEFKAHYCDKNQGEKQQHIHHEISHFVLHQQQWYFLDPTLDMQVTMKQSCICGSGKKFKQCCAQFI